MSSQDGLYQIVFNGEMYNYVELRNQLEGLGYAFESSSDTEVLLNANRQWWSDCVDRLVGMWAFLIFDRHKQILFGSRDRFGIKPLFFSRHGADLLFASEIKAILAGRTDRPQVNWRAAAAFLARGALDRTKETFFEGITSVSSAHSFEVELSTGRIRQWRYWSLPNAHESCSDAPRRFADLFDQAMTVHARSDVPIAVHLSGGLDSTSIACSLAPLRGFRPSREPLKAICFADPSSTRLMKSQPQLAGPGQNITR